MSDSLIPSFFVRDVSEALRSLIKNEQFERIAQVAHQKLSKSFICLSKSLFCTFFCKKLAIRSENR